jgi:hypothetical protein
MTLRRESAAYAFDGHYCDSHAPFSSALLQKYVWWLDIPRGSANPVLLH